MKITDRVNSIDNVESAFWDGRQNKLTIYYHGDKETIKVKAAHALRQADVIDAIDNILLIEA
ncbi:hypothetical protein LCGC14_0543640 [marine sediment metagenome]|uniref:Uncharacterized protein n=1 Tax=marine sediment metagenome TaxID=412755 RepID=A0A0F9RS60_9ZZZZ